MCSALAQLACQAERSCDFLTHKRGTQLSKLSQAEEQAGAWAGRAGQALSEVCSPPPLRAFLREGAAGRSPGPHLAASSSSRSFTNCGARAGTAHSLPSAPGSAN